MIRIIKESKIEHHHEFSLNFDISNGAMYSFPCDHLGNILELPEAAKQNYQRCISGEAGVSRAPYITKNTYTEYIPAIGECVCGAEVSLDIDAEGLCYCYCGKCYNGAGQSIRPRSEWEERYDDNY